jgi:ribose/xylose/arabinose/galactoside ABC-type transport system permease subunit
MAPPVPRALARRFGVVAGLLVLCLLLWILTPYFLTVANLLNVMEQTAINAIVAVGMTYVIISAGSICPSARSSRSPVWCWRWR